MKTTHGALGLFACGMLGLLALADGRRPASAVPVRPPTAPAAEAPAPLLLDPSLKFAARSPADGPREAKDLAVPRPGAMRVALDVLADGRPLPTVRHAGKTYLPVPRTGEEYQLRVWNHGPRRVAAVLSVDGLSVITGRPASEDDPGYLVAPYGSVVIKGWRRNLDNVAAFRFVERDRSYASLMGRPENVGVIGLVAFEERVVHPLPQFERRAAAPDARGFRTAVGSIGTEYGREIDSRAYYVPFVRSGNKQSITLYYDTAEALREAGVPVDRPAPDPFPGDLRFAPPPPAYRGR